MNCWVVICKCKSFLFSASTPFPAVEVFLLQQLHFYLKVSSPHSVCKVLLESCPQGPSAGLKLRLQCKYFIFQIASSNILSGQCQAGHSLYTVYTVQLRGAVLRSASVSGSFFMCHLQILLSPTQLDFLHREVAGSKVLYTMKYLH